MTGWRPYKDQFLYLAKACKRGYPADGISKILGGNFLRVFKEVWRDA